MKCQKCESKRIASIGAKCSDMCMVTLGEREHHGYVPQDMGIGGGDYIEIELCLDCGHANGKWPIPPTKLEEEEEED